MSNDTNPAINHWSQYIARTHKTPRTTYPQITPTYPQLIPNLPRYWYFISLPESVMALPIATTYEA